MSGILYVEDTAVEATTGQMLITFESGGEKFRFHLPPHIALRFRQRIIKDSWQVVCAPDADLVPFKLKRSKGKA